MEKLLNELLCNLRATQMIYHQIHNMTEGADFFGDHSAFGQFYLEVEEEYDSVAERAIGLGFVPLLGKIMQSVVDTVDKMSFDSTDKVCADLLGCEVLIRHTIDELCKQSQITEGTRNLIAGISDESEVRTYKLKQRLA